MHLHVDVPQNSPAITRAKACDCYIANTEFERKKLISYGVNENKVVTIGIGIDLDRFQADKTLVYEFRARHNIKDTDVLVGYVGRLVKGKGVPVLIDAFRKVYQQNNNVKLLLAGGSTDYVPQIKRIIQEENLPIILIQDFEEEMKGLLYNALDIFVLASQSELFGIVFLEAWACKKPVVATRMGATVSLLSENDDSMFFKPKDVDELADKLSVLIENSSLREQLGVNGFNKVKERFTWPTIAAKYRDAYQLGIANFRQLNKRSS